MEVEEAKEVLPIYQLTFAMTMDEVGAAGLTRGRGNWRRDNILEVFGEVEDAKEKKSREGVKIVTLVLVIRKRLNILLWILFYVAQL